MVSFIFLVFFLEHDLSSLGHSPHLLFVGMFIKPVSLNICPEITTISTSINFIIFTLIINRFHVTLEFFFISTSTSSFFATFISISFATSISTSFASVSSFFDEAPHYLSLVLATTFSKSLSYDSSGLFTGYMLNNLTYCKSHMSIRINLL